MDNDFFTMAGHASYLLLWALICVGAVLGLLTVASSVNGRIRRWLDQRRAQGRRR